MLASYIIDPSRTIEDVQSVMTHFDQTFVQDDVSVYGKGKSFHIPEDDILDKHIASILDAIHVVQPQMMTILEAHEQTSLLSEIELPLALILSEMEYIGIHTDIDTLKEMETVIQTELDQLIEQIHEQAGEKFNINSPKQLGVILFENLSCPSLKKNENGLFNSGRCARKIAKCSSNYRQHFNVSYVIEIAVDLC